MSEEIPPTGVDVEALLLEQRNRWERKTPLFIEALLAEHPGLARQKEALLDLINHEIVLRCEFGTAPTLEEYRKRFPELQVDLQMIFEVQEALEDETRTSLRNPSRSKHLASKNGADESASEANRATLGEPAAQPDQDWPRLPNFEILGVLGQGGMGIVYKALDKRLKRTVAVKMIRGGRVGAEERRRFQSEAEAVARLDHPGIVHIHEIGEHDRAPYFALEYVDGGSLGSRLQGAPQAPPSVARLIETLARAVHYAHGLGIVHRDLKPGNVLLQKVSESPSRLGDSSFWVHEGIAYQPKVADFGLAKHLQNETDSTQSRAIVGTPSYMAPEQAGDFSRRIGPPADVYALGAMLYEMITGRPPFRGESVLDTLDQLRTQEPVAPTRLQPRAPRDLETICLKCLRKDPAKRYESAEALADDLSRFLRHEPIQARPISAWQHFRYWCRRRPAVALLVAVMFVVTFVGFPLVVTQWLRAEASEAYAKTQLYDARISVAQRHWREGQCSRLRWLLTSLRPKEGEKDLRDFEWYYLWGLYDPDAARVPADRCLAWSPDGSLLAAGAKEEIHLWKTADLLAGGEPKPVGKFKGHRAAVTSLAFSSKGDRLLSGSLDQTARIWNVAGRETFKILIPHTAEVTAVAFSPVDGTTATACRDGVVRLWEEDGKARLLLDEHVGPVNDLAFGPDGKSLVSAGDDKFVIVWDAASGDFRHKLRAPEGDAVLTVAATEARGKLRIAAWGLDGHVRLWDADDKNAKQIHVYPAFAHPLRGLAFRADGKRLACAYEDRTIRVWELEPIPNRFLDEPILALKGHFHTVLKVAFSPSGQQLASVSLDGTLRVWDPSHEQESRVHDLPTAGNSMALCPNQPWVAVAGNDKKIHLWNWRTRADKTLVGHHAAVMDVAFAKDGTLASADAAGKICVWDIEQGNSLREFAGSGKPILALDFHPGGQPLVTADSEGIIRFWDSAGGRELYRGPPHKGKVNALAFDPLGRWLASAGEDGEVVLCAADSGREILRLSDPYRTPETLAFSADGSLLAAGDKQFTLRIWNSRTGARLQQLEGHEGDIQALAFSRNGRRLASASEDGTVKLWDVTTGLELLTLRGHGRDANGVFFIEDDTMLISLGRTALRQGQIRVWDSNPGRKQ